MAPRMPEPGARPARASGEGNGLVSLRRRCDAPPMRPLHSALVSLAFLLACGHTAGAWPPGGVQFERAEPPDANGIQGLGADGAGGTYTAWQERDTAGAFAFRVHRLNVQGDAPAGWTTAGVRVLSPGSGSFRAPLLVPDGVGGTYIAWTEYDSTAYVGHLAADGSVASGWPARGLPVSNFGRQPELVAAEDGAGGVLLAWRRTGSGSSSEIVTQRFLANGTRAPGFAAAGRALTGYDYQLGRFRPRLVRDADRGFWVSFHTVTIDVVLAPSAYAVLHLDPSGILTAGQPPNGLALSLPEEEIGTLEPPVPVALALDGVGGAFAFTLGVNGNVRAFHVLSTTVEDPSWPEGGWVIAGGAAWPSVHFHLDEENWPVAAGDLSSGAWVGWRDGTDFLLHVTRVLIDGTIASGWSSPLPIAGDMTVTLLGDPAGLYAASLAPVNCPHFNCYGPMALVRVSPDGSLAPGWPDASPPYIPAPGIVVGYGGPEDGPRLVADGTGGVVAAWNQYPEYHAMRFTVAGELAGVGPAAGRVELRARFDRAAGVRVWYSTGGERAARIELFDVAGRRVASASVAAGSGEIALAGTRTLGAGVFFARITTVAGTVGTKLVAGF